MEQFRAMRRKRQQLSEEESIGRIHIIEDEAEKLATAWIFGNRYNPNQEEALQKELESGMSRMLMIRFDIEHLTGKEAIELMKQREQSQACLNSAESRQKKTEGQLMRMHQK